MAKIRSKLEVESGKMVGKEQSTTGTSGLISRWGDLENNRSVNPKGPSFTTNLDKPLNTKTFTREPQTLNFEKKANKTGGESDVTNKVSELKGGTTKSAGLGKIKNPKSSHDKLGVNKSLHSTKFQSKSSTNEPLHITKLKSGAGKKKVVKKDAGKIKGKSTKKSKHDGVLIAIWVLVGVVIVVVVALVLGMFLPKIQKEERENQRIQDMVKTSNAVVRYQRDHSANRSNLPAAGSFIGVAEFPEDCALNSACDFVQRYLNSDEVSVSANEIVEDYTNHFKDPDGAYYNLVITENLATTKTLPEVFRLEGLEQEKAISDERLSYNGNGYEFVPAAGSSKENALSHTIYIVPGAKCNGELIVKATKSSFAIIYNFENGARCLSNN